VFGVDDTYFDIMFKMIFIFYIMFKMVIIFAIRVLFCLILWHRLIQ